MGNSKSTENSKWDMSTARLIIERTGGKIDGGKITHPSPGLKVLGAIDYLVNYCKYVWSVHQKVQKNKEV